MTTHLTVPAVESPSLLKATQGIGPAFEMKFLVAESQALEVEAWARQHLHLDPHGDSALKGAYRTTSLYMDTPDRDVFHRRDSYRRRKFRIRRYGDSPSLYLERKSKSGDKVAKRRSALPVDELTLLANPMSLLTWDGHWFHRRLLKRHLAPACRISYQRTAYVGVSPESPLRVTLDRRLFGLLTPDWSLGPVEGGLPLLTGQVILELKFRTAMPLLFKELIQDQQLTPRAVSKYRHCMLAWGATEGRREAADA